ncbi:MAG: endonuclease III [Pyrobaculum sp.]
MSELIEAVDNYVKLRLEEFVAPVVWREGGNLFELVVAVVLSQNTSDKNAFKAYKALKERLGVLTPDSVLSLSEKELADVIRPAGMYNIRARHIRAIAEAFTRLGITPEKLRAMGVEEARRLLMSLPGIGEKTADVVLVNLGMPAFPVDTHITRIARRWGVGRRYREISRWFMERVPPQRYLEVHLKLIQFGRDVCTAKSPKCHICPVGKRCPSYRDETR